MDSGLPASRTKICTGASRLASGNKPDDKQEVINEDDIFEMKLKDQSQLAVLLLRSVGQRTTATARDDSCPGSIGGALACAVHYTRRRWTGMVPWCDGHQWSLIPMMQLRFEVWRSWKQLAVALAHKFITSGTGGRISPATGQILRRKSSRFTVSRIATAQPLPLIWSAVAWYAGRWRADHSVNSSSAG